MHPTSTLTLLLATILFKWLGDHVSVVHFASTLESAGSEPSGVSLQKVGCFSHVNATKNAVILTTVRLIAVDMMAPESSRWGLQGRSLTEAEWLFCLCPRSGMLEAGVDRIISQVVDPKLNHIFRPQIEKAIHDFLAAQKKEDLVPAPPPPPEPESQNPSPPQDTS